MFASATYLLGLIPVFAVVVAQDEGNSTTNGTANAAGYDTSRVGPSNANCQRETYQLNITSNNVQFQNVDPNANNTYLTSLRQTFLASPTNLTQQITTGNTSQVSNTYSLSGTLCTPSNGSTNASEIQFLVHGVGFDASYWDFSIDGSDNYSYVSAAAAAGWSTFRYDRLGTGLSEHPADVYNAVQAPTDLAIAGEFVNMLRNGQVNGTAFTRIVGIGHSYGSVQVQALTATAPQLLDAAVLTGFSVDNSGQVLFIAAGAYGPAIEVAPERYANASLPNAYVQNGLISGTQLDFFWFPGFEQAALNRSFETIQPVAPGVLQTLSPLVQNASNFSGPVQVVTGAHDLPFCKLNCYNVTENSTYASLPAAVQQLYPAASNFSVYIPENTGHGLNAHLSAPQTYQEILQFITTSFSNSSSNSTQ